MRFPRDVSGAELARLLRRFGCELTRQSGSHMRRTTQREGEHHITIPNADPLRVGTLAAIVGEVSRHFSLPPEDLHLQLFGKNR